MSAKAAAGRRKHRRHEWGEQVRLTLLLNKYIDPSCAFWSSLENQPRSRVSGMLARMKGVRSGLPDTMAVFRGKAVFVELKSKAGRTSRAQKEVRAGLVAAGCDWWMARSARAAMTALNRSGVPFRRRWNPLRLQPWEGPFTGEEARLPQHPSVAARQRAMNRRWREKYRDRPITVEQRARRQDASAMAEAEGRSRP